MRVLLEPVAGALDNALQLKRAEALSVTDDLTHLYNSRYLNQVLRRETKRASRSGRPLSLLFIDLDGFKSINDRHGHLCGSRALVEAAAVIRGSARETDVVARFGGDEFAMVLPDTGGEGAFAVGERVRERIAAHHFLDERGPEHPADGVGRRRDAARRGLVRRRAGAGGRHGHVPGEGSRQERHSGRARSRRYIGRLVEAGASPPRVGRPGFTEVHTCSHASVSRRRCRLHAQGVSA